MDINTSEFGNEVFLGTDEIEDEAVIVNEYDIVSQANDFNIKSLCGFIDDGRISIPQYQRNYVWDKTKASKLVESLILNLPIPQIFLYESKGEFEIIDGQQRLLSAYFFSKGRFPKNAFRLSLRDEWNEKGGIRDALLNDDGKFETFSLQLGKDNRLNGVTYEERSEIGNTLDIRTLRSIAIRQINPAGNTAKYEIFSRLNTGGVNLTPQEIRCAIATSKMLNFLIELNKDSRWRSLVGVKPNAQLRDLEILHRAISITLLTAKYKPPMKRFLDETAEDYKQFTDEDIVRITEIVDAFFNEPGNSSREYYLASNRFSVPIFESVFAGYYDIKKQKPEFVLTSEMLEQLTNDKLFRDATADKTTNIQQVQNRIGRATEVFNAAG